MALLFLAAAVLYAVLPATASAGSRIQLKAPAHAKVGRPFDVTLRVVGGARISGFEAELHFDTGAAEFASADYRRSELRKLLGSLHQLGPVELNDGVALGSYSCLTADCAPRGLKATIKGAKGSFVLARVRLTPRIAGRLEIRLGAVELVASDGTRLAAPRGCDLEHSWGRIRPTSACRSRHSSTRASFQAVAGAHPRRDRRFAGRRAGRDRGRASVDRCPQRRRCM